MHSQPVCISPDTLPLLFQVPYFTGSYVAYNIAQHLPQLATHMGGSDVQAFLLMLAPLVQVIQPPMIIKSHSRHTLIPLSYRALEYPYNHMITDPCTLVVI